jgi:hypothetical protein
MQPGTPEARWMASLSQASALFWLPPYTVRRVLEAISPLTAPRCRDELLWNSIRVVLPFDPA